MPTLDPQLRGREYWLGLEHLANTPEFAARFDDEFSGYNPEAMRDGVSRRSFLKFMGAAMGLAGLTASGCRRWPEEQIRPFAHQPDGFKPGVAVHYATMAELGGVATGLLVKSYDGRPIKVEGNPLHPASGGATEPWQQASVLDIYDPQRSRVALEKVSGQTRQRSWDDFAVYLRSRLDELRGKQGQGLAILAEAMSGPTAVRLREAFRKAYPKATWTTWEPIHRDAELEGSRLAFGKPLRPVYHLDKAQVIVSFEDDLLGQHPNRLSYARDWARGRKSADQGRMNRLYVIEGNLSTTGSVADHRIALRPSQQALLLQQLAAELGVRSAGNKTAQLRENQREAFSALVKDLQTHQGTALVTVGLTLPAEYHALAHAINQKLGAIGQTITLNNESETQGQVAALRRLTRAMDQGQVDTLIVLGGNPVFDAPANLNFATGYEKVAHTIHLSHEVNETSAASLWHLPRAHALECWGDGRSWDGTLVVQQPLILPLFEGRSVIEVLAMVLGQPTWAGMELVRETWRGIVSSGPAVAEQNWRKVLHDGTVRGSAWKSPRMTDAKVPEKLPEIAVGGDDQFEAIFVADASVYDGRFASNGWLQEMPDPLSKLTWDNCAYISKADADRLGIKHGMMLQLDLPDQGRSSNLLPMEVAAFIQPGIAPGTIVLPLGYGRKVCGSIGQNVGFDTYAIRADGAYLQSRMRITRLGKSYELVTTQEHHLIDGIGVYGRDKRAGKPGKSGYLIREASLEDYKADQKVFHRDVHGVVHLQLFDPPHQFNDPHAWGMAIDMNACIGCNACVIACQAENNVPIVGKVEVSMNREMHWLRIDRYFKGDAEFLQDVQTVYSPMTCVHCENAPCEQVCPVAATVHDTEGLNTMVYNRCIGTRYCSNNCPYKVRRFNYFDWHTRDPKLPGNDTPPFLNIPDQQLGTIDQIKRMVFNPEVTVRMRGVMEKCTYCTQRIAEAKIQAKVQQAQGNRTTDLVQDGEVTTACQQSCPTQAIVFGNLNDPTSRVAQIHKQHRSYAMLEELNVKPRTKYLAKVRNPAVKT